MHTLQRLRHWLRDWRVARHACKGHAVDRRTPSQHAPPLARSTDPNADPRRLRLRKSAPGATHGVRQTPVPGKSLAQVRLESMA
jgi:hypothetical protein